MDDDFNLDDYAVSDDDFNLEDYFDEQASQPQQDSQPQQQRLQNLPYLQDWAESLEKHPGLKSFLGGAAKVAEPINKAVEFSRIPEIAGGILNVPISIANLPLSIAQSFKSSLPDSINKITASQFNPEEYSRDDLVSKGAFMLGEFLGLPGAPGAAKSAAKAIPNAIKNSKYRSENILNKILEDESKFSKQYKEKYNNLWKESKKADVANIELGKNGASKLKQDLNFIKENELPDYTEAIELFLKEPSIQNAHKAKSELGSALRNLYNKKAANKTLDPFDQKVFKRVSSAKKGLEEAMSEAFSKSKNPNLASEYEKITEGYAKDVIPYSQLPALNKYKARKLKSHRFANKLSKEQSDAFMRAKEDLYPEIKRRENFINGAKLAGYGGGGLLGLGWIFDKAYNLLKD